VTSREFRERLTRRAAKYGVALPDEPVLQKLELYFSLLRRWNEKINLTALPIQKANDAAFDRLLIEPLAASRHFPSRVTGWFDLGSGGGSPAVPLKLARPQARLTMVESKVRKAAFLREAIRAMELDGATVENERFEVVATCVEGSAASSPSIVSVRAVRPDAVLTRAAAQLLKSGGQLFMFRPDAKLSSLRGFEHTETLFLLHNQPSFLAIYERVFHVEH
jgi:16S rRNA (guanine527-N7)-methyltransferase